MFNKELIFMKKIILLLFSVSISCVIAAQSKEFIDYLEHCRKKSVPFELSMDSTKRNFPSIGKQGTEVPDNYIHRFICEAGKPCNDDPSIYRYDYGVRANVDDFIVVFLNKLCYECPTDFSISSAETLMLVYTKEGKLVSAMPILKESDQHFYNSKISECDAPNCILKVHTVQGTAIAKSEKGGIYKAICDDYIYTVNDKGIISRKKVGTEKVKAKLYLEPRYQMKVIEKGW